MRALQTSQVRWPSYVGHGRSPDFSMFSPICPGRKWIDGQFTQGMLVKKKLGTTSWNSESIWVVYSCQSLLSIVNHYYPLYTAIILLPIANQYQSLPITINHD